MPENRQLDEEISQRLMLVPGHGLPVHQHRHGHVVYPATGVLSVTTAAGTWIAPANRSAWTPAGFDHHHRAHGRTDMRVLFLPPSLAARLPAHPSVLAVTPLAREALLALTEDEQDLTTAMAGPDGTAGPGRTAPADGAAPAAGGQGLTAGPDGTAPTAVREGTRPAPSAGGSWPARSAEAASRLRAVAVDELVLAPEQPLHLPVPRDPRLRALAGLLLRDPASPATLAELGHQVGASERTLSRLFHSELGMSFRQWRGQLRIHHALVLLASGRAVTDTALACGWANPTSFIDAFTAVLGQTPGRYRSELDPGGKRLRDPASAGTLTS
jgi:AraC-like DNA-binding protein